MPPLKTLNPPGSFLRPKMPELDSLRGIACLLVLLFHGFGNRYSGAGLPAPEHWFIAFTSYGWTGVNLFFILSGFLITGILIDSKDSPRYYGRFYFRRALRILPAYYGVLVVVLLLVQTHMVDRPVSWGFLGLSAIYLANATPLFGITPEYGVLWSLAVEEHFYLLWPLCVRKLRMRGIAILAGSIVVLSLCARIVAFATGHNALDHYTWLVADGLAMGALLAIAARAWQQNRRTLRRFAAAALIVSFASYAVDGLLRHPFAGGALHITSFNSFFLALVTATLLLGSRFPIRNSVLEFFGEISYGLYLIHLLCFDLYDHYAVRYFPSVSDPRGNFLLMTFRFVMAGGLAVAVAAASRHYFEEPFLRLKERFPFEEKPEPAAPQELAESA